MKEKQLVNVLRAKKETISTMESCTAGYLATTITNVDNSSEVLKFSAITYSNEFKVKMGVDKKTIDKYSVYSFNVSRQMAKAISDFTKSTYGVGITGKINRVDVNNIAGKDNEIFVTIYSSISNNYEDVLITCPNKPREKCKKYIVSVVISKLLDIVSE